MKNKHSAGSRRYSGTIFLMALSILCAVGSGLLLFAPQIETVLICRVLAVGLMIWGIVQMCRFFLVRAYHQLHDYSFSMGALLVILGCVALVRVEDVTAHLEIVLQLATLCLGVVLVQNTIQLKSTNSFFWAVEGICALAIVLCSVLSLTAPGFIVPHLVVFTHWSLFAAGIISTVSFPIVALNLYRRSKRDIAQAAAVELEKGNTPAPSTLPMASFGDTDELDVESIRAKAEETAHSEAE